MRIECFGASCVKVTSSNGTSVIFDPYKTWGDGVLGTITKLVMGLKSPRLREKADIVLVTHNHPDHNNTKAISGNPEILSERKGVGRREILGIPVIGIANRHGFTHMGNTIFKISTDGFDICHLGDIGRQLTSEERRELGNVDILLAPGGGFPIMHPTGVAEVCRQINPRIIIPIHYRSSNCLFVPPHKKDKLLNALSSDYSIQNQSRAWLDIAKDDLPSENTVWVFPSF